MSEYHGAPRGSTCHYQLHDHGLLTVWGADFLGDKSGAYLHTSEEQEKVIGHLDPANQTLYADMRTRPSDYEVDMFGKCVVCEEYITPTYPIKDNEPHFCEGA